MSKKAKALKYFYDRWYEIDSSIDYKDENIKNALIDAFIAGFKSNKKNKP